MNKIQLASTISNGNKIINRTHLSCKVVLLLFFFLPFACQQESPPENILLVHSNEPIPFKSINPGMIRQAVSKMVTLIEKRINAISAKAPTDKTDDTIMAIDEMGYDINELFQKLQLISALFPDDSMRAAAYAGEEKLEIFTSKIVLNESFYKSIKQYASILNVAELPASKTKFLREYLISFEQNGMKLNVEERKSLEQINEKIIKLELQFDTNIAESKDSVEFNASELQGVPPDVMEPWKRNDPARYVVYVDEPNQRKISRYAVQSNTRKRMSRHFNNIAYPENITVLDSLYHYRDLMAKKIGYKTYAEYELDGSMASKPAHVWSFENDLIVKLSPRVKQEMNTLKILKNKLHPKQSDTLYAWDMNYYTKQLLDIKYDLKTDEVMEYFEVKNTIAGMFKVFEKLFSIQIQETNNVPTWITGVQTFEMRDGDKKLGTIYFDLYARPNKFTGAFCSQISLYREREKNEILPSAVLVFNFAEPTADTPTLLTHSDCVTLFHEFGHLVHALLSRTKLATQSSFRVKADFMEAPSQLLENWCWNYQSLKMVAKHYKTGAILPERLFQKMKATQLVNSATYAMWDVYCGIIDFTYADKYDEVKKRGLLQTSKDLYAIRQLPYPEGSNFISSFGHLNSYAANYYGYLWSKVFAQDMFSVFEKDGIMNEQLGMRYRREVLEKGSEEEEINMVRNFLNRDPNSDAFMRSLGISTETVEINKK